MFLIISKVKSKIHPLGPINGYRGNVSLVVSGGPVPARLIACSKTSNLKSFTKMVEITNFAFFPLPFMHSTFNSVMDNPN